MTPEPLASVIIPVWRDEEGLSKALRGLTDVPALDIVVAPALGEESSVASLRASHPAIRWAPAPRGRASQMNAGAAVARGRWLVFLHADTRLPAEWLRAIADADARPEVVAGSFRLRLDSRDVRARVIELGVRLRVALLDLPYGDQALFVRRHTFDALGGYRDLPLMEDVDFVRRVRTTGRLLHARDAVLTSARRWERDGWLRRSARNVGLATRFMLGAPAADLARRYVGRRSAAVVMMARAPWIGGKTRLVAGDAAAHAAIREALFLDTHDVVASVPGVEHVVACEPSDACERMRAIVAPTTDVVAQRGADLGERMVRAFEDVFRLGSASVVVVGSDLPDLPARVLNEAVAALERPGDRAVLGPAADGGYYLIGLKRPHPELFEGIAWGTDRVLARTLEAASAQDVPVVLLERWADVDDAADLERLARTPGEPGAARTRARAREHLGRS